MASKEIRELENKIEALVIAIPREMEAYDYYMRLVDQYEDDSSKEMFRFLAQQELKHKEKLEELLEKLEQELLDLKKQ